MEINPGNKDLTNQEISRFEKEQGRIRDKFISENEKLKSDLEEAKDSGNLEKLARAQLRLIEQRMKYAIANANKGQDRLTVADIRDAESNTRIFGLLEDPEKVKSNYTRIEQELNQLFVQNAKNYVRNGGTPTSVYNNYIYIKPINRAYRQKQQKATQKKIKETDYTNILEGI